MREGSRGLLAPWYAGLFTAVCATLLLFARVAPAAAKETVLLVVPPDVPEDLVEVKALVMDRVTAGLRTAIEAVPSESSRFTTHFFAGQLEADRRKLAGPILEYEQYSMQDLRQLLVALGGRYQRNAPSGMLQVSLTTLGNDLLVSLMLFNLREKTRDTYALEASKTVRGSLEDQADFANRVQQAAESLASKGKKNSAPVVHVRLEPRPTVEPGTEVTLHGEDSHDPDQDTLTYQWQERLSGDGLPEIVRVVPGGATLKLRHFEEGEHHYRLMVQELAKEKAESISDWQTLRVIRSRADAGRGELTRKLGLPIELDGSRSYPEPPAGTMPWEQISGPAVDIVVAASNPLRASFTPRVAGIYAFRLHIGPPDVERTAEVSYLVAPPPSIPRPPPYLDVQPNVPFRLDRHGATDQFDPKPEFFWTITRGEATAYLSDRRSPTPDFVACQPGSYEVTLEVRAKRELYGKTLFDTNHVTYRLRAVRSSWHLFLQQSTRLSKRALTSTRLGANILFSRLWWKYSSPSFGLRFDQSFVTVALGGKMAFEDRLSAGGGTLVAATAEAELFSRAATSIYLGYWSRFQQPAFVAGLSPSLHLSGPIFFTVDTAASVAESSVNYDTLEFWAGLGLGWRP